MLVRPARGHLRNNITSIAEPPATYQPGDKVAKADASDQDNAHLSQRIRHLEAEVGRLNQALEERRMELVAKDARITELTSDGFSTGAKRPRR
jgi:flagellar motility protein MotE (MotC chaperone)